MTPKGQSQKDARMRREGYDDGYARRPARSQDATYQQAWRRGRGQREHDEVQDKGGYDARAWSPF